MKYVLGNQNAVFVWHIKNQHRNGVQDSNDDFECKVEEIFCLIKFTALTIKLHPNKPKPISASRIMLWADIWNANLFNLPISIYES